MASESSAVTEGSAPGAPAAGAGRDTLGSIFGRFLHFGLLAFGGPVAQIAMLRAELVDRERWVSREQFNRALGLYQILPGPEATELSVWFGMKRRGFLGGLLAGLGFVLPGLVLMLLACWVYVRFGVRSPLVLAAFAGCQPAVGALIVRAVHRIGSHTVTDRWLWGIAAVTGVSQLLQVHFAIPLIAAGLVYSCARRSRPVLAALVIAGFLGAAGAWMARGPSVSLSERLEAPAYRHWAQGWIGRATEGMATEDPFTRSEAAGAVGEPPAPMRLFGSGLQAGLLTFGGAYTVIPFVRADAVVPTGAHAGAAETPHGWMTGAQFLDGLALGGVLPAPLVIFCTFVGYIGGGLTGALLMTLGVFLPAFAFTLVAHNQLERLMNRVGFHAFFDGVTAGVVGIIAATTLSILRESVTDWTRLAIFAVALVILYRCKQKWIVAAIMGGAAAVSVAVSLV